MHQHHPAPSVVARVRVPPLHLVNPQKEPMRRPWRKEPPPRKRDGARLARYEQYVLKAKASDKVKLMLGMDDEDLRNECRVRVWRAVETLQGREVTPLEELKYVRTALKHYLIDIGRRADARSRAVDDDAAGSILVDTTTVFDSGQGRAPSPEDDAVEAERRMLMRRQIGLLRSKIPGERMAVLENRVVHDLPHDPANRGAAKSRYQRIVRAARRALGVPAFDQLLDHYTEPEVPVPVESMSAENLARMLIVNELPAEPFDRDHLVATVAKMNTDPESGELIEIPTCFGKEYEANDTTCTEDCDFHRECRVIKGASGKAPELRDAKVEAQLVKIQTRHLEKITPKVEEPAFVPPAKTESAPTNEELKRMPGPVVGDVYLSNDKRIKRYVKVEAVTDTHVELLNVTQGARAMRTKVSLDNFVSKSTRGFTFDRHEPSLGTQVKTPNGATVTMTKHTPRKPKAPPPPAGDRYITLSQRRGVLPKGAKSYSLKPDGTRWTRLPQGSAAYLAERPVGTIAEREWKGHLYRAKKVQDGVTTTKADGHKRKRDGRWRLIEIFKLVEHKKKDGTKEMKRGAKVDHVGKAKVGLEGSANQLAFAITGSNVWSGAKFFAMLPTALDPSSGKFDPKKFKPQSPYRFEADG